MWARVASVALSGAVAVLMNTGECRGNVEIAGTRIPLTRHTAPVDPIVAVAKRCFAPLYKSIMIADDSPDIDKDRILLSSAAPIVRAAFIIQLIDAHEAFRAPDTLGAGRHNDVPLSSIERETRIIAGRTVLDLDGPAKRRRGQIPRILDSHVSQHCPHVEHLMDAVRFNANIGALENFGVAFLPFGSSFGKPERCSRLAGLEGCNLAASPDLSLAGVPQFFGGEPKQNSRDRQDYSEGGSYPFPVFMNELTNTDLADAGRSREIGDTFFKIFGGVMLSMFLYALLKRV